MSIILTMSFTLTIMFMFMNHPLSMGFVLMTQTICISLMSGFLNINFWYSYIIFIVMVGGMLVLFIYMTSIASNEKFYLKEKELFIISILSLIFMILLNLNLEQMNQEYLIHNNSNYWTLTLSKFMSFPHNMMVILIITYLLITLIAVVKITMKISGPLRTNN